ncbi:hypothetical protein [Variovorax ginsengisoli]|uniref:Uncharacterized protein n=1 Tax=Variovorax ginsengisoli TaxID=363844 RepID=A0ABT9S1F2_9BURK|nr:hypothetical protein [Variovorax ginsengisoli]MDP9898185.1 hypothetical protein [Variovorax ginsengisoli]
MSSIYDQVIAAIQQHWRAHDNKYPQKIVLASAQHHSLMDIRRIGRTALAATGEIEADRFMGTALEIDDTSPGIVVSIDGVRTALAG